MKFDHVILTTAMYFQKAKMKHNLLILKKTTQNKQLWNY